ncbi:N-6 DNA methylase [Nocardia thailandica]
MSEPSTFLTPSQLADRIGVTISAVSNWRTRHADFPDRQVVDGQDVFDTAALIQWLSRRTIPRNRLLPEENSGTSYGDRLSRATGPVAAVPAATTAVPQASGPLAGELWSVYGALRGRHDPATISALVVALLYVKAVQPDTWRAVADTTDWDTKLELLRRVRVPDGDGELIPAFQSLDSTRDASVVDAIERLDRVDLDSSASQREPVARMSSSIFEEAGHQLGGRGGHFTPPMLAGLLVDILDPAPGSDVYDPFCGSAELLVAAHEHTARRAPLSLFGCPPSAAARVLSSMNLTLHGIEADLCSPGYALIRDGFPDRRFDHIVMNPPFGLKMDLPEHRWAFGAPPPARVDLGWLQYVVSKLVPGGTAAVLLPMGAGFRSGREAQIRAAIVRAGVVDCVIALPQALFAETAIAAALWVVRAPDSQRRADGRTLMIDASGSGDKQDGSQRLSVELSDRIVREYKRWHEDPASFRGERGFSRSVDSDGLAAAQFDLSPRRFVGMTESRPTVDQSIETISDLHRRFEENMVQLRGADLAMRDAVHVAQVGRPETHNGEFVRLGSIAEVLAGPGSVNREQAEPTMTPLVLPRNIREGAIGSGNLDTVTPAAAAKLSRFRLDGGDIVTARAGTLGRFGRVSDSQAGWLLGPGCVRIRPHRHQELSDAVDSGYLTSYLNSPPAQEWVASNSMGSAIPHISAARLKELPVWLPALGAQRAIAEQLERLREAASAYRQMSDLVLAVREELSAALVPFALDADLHREPER